MTSTCPAPPPPASPDPAKTSGLLEELRPELLLATPGQLLLMALRRAEQHRINKFQENKHRREFICNTGRLNRSQCRRLVLEGKFFGPERADLHPMVPNNCHGNSIELVKGDAGLALWTGLAFNDWCSDGGSNGWFAHSWVIDGRGVVLETSPKRSYWRDELGQDHSESTGWQGYFGIRLDAREIARWLLRDYGQP
jgi:hypothetical protein